MSRSLWRCRNRDCSVPHGAVLGRVTADEGLVLDMAVCTLRVFLDTRRAMIECPACGAVREFRGPAVATAFGRSVVYQPPTGRFREASRRPVED
jgi:hypothetical protein